MTEVSREEFVEVRVILQDHLRQCAERTADNTRVQGQMIEAVAAIRRQINAILLASVGACLGLIGTLVTLLVTI